MILKRKIYERLIGWKKQNGATSLLIEGARRIGKSVIAETFAKNEYKSYILIDFSVTSQIVKDIFLNYNSNLNDLFFNLSAAFGVTLHERETLFIFDEVQLFPFARQLTKQLVLDGRYDYLLTGSLLTIKSNKAGIMLPSEEDSIKMYPLDFEEFLWANGRYDLPQIIRKSFEERKPLKEIHSVIMKYFRQYLLIGGMPQPVVEFIKTADYTKVDVAKRRILKLYRNDVAKYAEEDERKVRQIFDDIPAQLSTKEKKFKLSSLDSNARKRDYEDAFMWLDDAMITNSCFNARDPQLGLGLYTERPTLKSFFVDTGLLLSHSFNEKEFIQKELALAIISDNLSFNNGVIMENVVAQMLVANGNALYFYSRYSDNKKDRMEIDFLISDPFNYKKIIPIEVKSSKTYTTVSLNKFLQKFSDKVSNGIILHTKDLKVEKNIYYLPIYMTFLL